MSALNNDVAIRFAMVGTQTRDARSGGRASFGIAQGATASGATVFSNT